MKINDLEVFAVAPVRCCENHCKIDGNYSGTMISTSSRNLQDACLAAN